MAKVPLPYLGLYLISFIFDHLWGVQDRDRGPMNAFVRLDSCMGGIENYGQSRHVFWRMLFDIL